MPLPAGTRLGPYEIIGPIGAGGMGEVYRAHDARLSRDVAIKVLPNEKRRDPDRVRRFEQEVRAAGSLNHPNILVVYDVGVSEDGPYFATELLDGETLRATLVRAPVGTKVAISIALQIARGLAAAHARGIIHRDLKPENVVITRDGVVKIIDFGIAKMDPRLDPDASNRETVAATGEGTVVGTAAYMSPEQISGRQVTTSTDVFAFG